MQSLKELLTSRNDLVGQARVILDRAEGEKRDLNSEERSEYDKIDADIDKLSERISAKHFTNEKRGKLQSLQAQLLEEAPRQVVPAKPGVMPEAKGGDGASLTFDFGRAGKVELAPESPLWKRGTDGYRQAFGSYLKGDKRDFESLGLVVANDPKGGYLAPMAFVAMLIKFLDDNVFMRGLATVLPPTTAKTVGALSFDTDPGDADWTAEVPASDISEDDAARFGTREMIPHLLTKLLKASRKLVRASSLNLDTFLAQRLAYKFGITEEKAFLTGTGAQQPLGVFVADANGITTSQDVTASSATAFTADDLINTLYDLKEAYMLRATWMMSREGVKRCRKLKDGNGQYLWQPGLTGGQPGLILDRPYKMSEYVPSTFTTGLYVAAVGDFSNYWIQDGLGLEIQRLEELFALRNQVGWLARKETDAMPVLAEAFRRLKLG